MKLLFITQKLHGQDAFGALWAKAFADRGYTVEIVCLEARPEAITSLLGEHPDPRLRIHSMGKEKGFSRWQQILTFWKLTRRLQYDRVFIHMSPVWGLLGAWKWIPSRTPTYLWYTHYKMQPGLWSLGFYAKRMFCATPQSLPQYEGNPKKIVTGHGIDLAFWPKRENHAKDPRQLLGVYRLSRSKRLELCIRAMALLPEYTWNVFGIVAEADYVAEMKALVSELQLNHRVRFHPSVPAKELASLYARHKLILNMASETIDKTMLEAMTCGCYPVTTARNAEAIGITAAPMEDTPESIALFIKEHTERLPMEDDAMYKVVAERHGLAQLIERMDSYIRPGN
jgi:glycosyltransferase involved in cell wall biosynthesis